MAINEHDDVSDQPPSDKTATQIDGREALLRAAFSLFAAEGYQQTSTRAIAERAGVSLGLIHRHFGSIDNLLEETDRRLLQWADKRLEQRLRLFSPKLGHVSDEPLATSAEDSEALAYMQKAVTQARPGSKQLSEAWLQSCTRVLQNAEAEFGLKLQQSARHCAEDLLAMEIGLIVSQQLGLRVRPQQQMQHFFDGCIVDEN